MIQNILKTSLFALFFMATAVLSAQNQDLQLAQQYMRSNEYEKASSIFEKLYEKQNTNSYYYQNYFKCLIALENFEAAEDLLKQQKKNSKKRGNTLSLEIDLAKIYEQQGKTEQAEKQYLVALEALNGKTLNQARTIANTYQNYDKGELALQVYEKAAKFSDEPKQFAYEKAIAYKRIGEIEKMVDNFLDVGEVQPNRVQYVRNELQRVLDSEKYRDYIEEQLYARIQSNAEAIVYPELLAWFYIQNKDYESALVQAKALDRRLEEYGERVLEIGTSALNENEYETAIEAYDYVASKGQATPLYLTARQATINAKMKGIVYTNQFDESDLKSLEADYLSLLDELGRTPDNVKTMLELSRLYAFYLHDLNKAIAELEKVLEMPSTNRQLMAQCKLDLGDYYIISGDIWEASLLYSQVDKSFKEDILGEEARFRNAKLSYYNGDFEWAQSQLNVLKASTSELISNDALELSIFMIDNMGMDTTTTAMNLFAGADLLIFQNKNTEALELLNKIEREFPAHMLLDDILFRRAEIAYQQKDYTKTIEILETIVADHTEGILVDNSLFWLAEIHERQFSDTDKAMTYYEEIIVNQPGSLFIVEARKRFRELRGDNAN